jgi:DNA-binding MurR/RpiR family transcriptional regulator
LDDATTTAPERAAPRGGVHAELVMLFEQRRLTPSQRRIGQYVIEHPREVVFLGAGELAERTRVSQPSVSRFAQALGFRGYPEFSRYLRELTRDRADADPDHGGRTRLQEAVEAEIRNLRVLQEALGDSGVERLGEQLAASIPLTVLGLRSSAGIVGYFRFFAAKVHPDVRIATSGGSAAAEELRQARDAGGTWLLCFALPRCPRETIEALEVAHDLGFSIAVVADRELAPAAQLADVTLSAPVSSQLVFDSRAAPMVLTTVLLDSLANATPARTQARLEAFEQAAQERRYFHPD